MSKQVTYAMLHEGFFIPAMGQAGGQFDKTLPPVNKTLKEFRMSLNENGSLLCEWEDGAFTKSFTVAAANVKIALHAPVPSKPKNTK